MASKGCGAKYVLAELYRMKAAGLKGRSAADADIDASLSVLSEELAGFEAAVVSAACREWTRGHDWWPTLHELLDAVGAEQAAVDARRRPRLPPPRPRERSHEEIMADIERKMAWATDIRAICGGEMPMAWKRSSEDGPVVAVRWTPNGPWVAPGPRRQG